MNWVQTNASHTAPGTLYTYLSHPMHITTLHCKYAVRKQMQISPVCASSTIPFCHEFPWEISRQIFERNLL